MWLPIHKTPSPNTCTTMRRNARLTHVVQADATDIEALRRLGVHQFGHAVVGIGTHMEASVLAVLALSELGVADIWAKAITVDHGRILERTGAHHIIAPEADSCTLQIGGSPMFGTSIYGLYVVVIVKFKLKVGTDVGTVYSLLIGIGLAYKVEVGKWELKGLLAITFMAVFGDTVCGYAIGFLVKVSLDLSPVFCVEVSLEGKAARLTVHSGLPDETVFCVSKLVFAVEVSLVLVLSISFEVETKQVTVLRGPLTKDALPDAL